MVTTPILTLPPPPWPGHLFLRHVALPAVSNLAVAIARTTVPGVRENSRTRLPSSPSVPGLQPLIFTGHLFGARRCHPESSPLSAEPAGGGCYHPMSQVRKAGTGKRTRAQGHRLYVAELDLNPGGRVWTWPPLSPTYGATPHLVLLGSAFSPALLPPSGRLSKTSVISKAECPPQPTA